MSCAGQSLVSHFPYSHAGLDVLHKRRRCRLARERGTGGTNLADCVIVWLVNRLGRVLLSLRRCHLSVSVPV